MVLSNNKIMVLSSTSPFSYMRIFATYASSNYAFFLVGKSKILTVFAMTYCCWEKSSSSLLSKYLHLLCSWCTCAPERSISLSWSAVPAKATHSPVIDFYFLCPNPYPVPVLLSMNAKQDTTTSAQPLPPFFWVSWCIPLAIVGL